MKRLLIFATLLTSLLALTACAAATVEPVTLTTAPSDTPPPPTSTSTFTPTPPPTATPTSTPTPVSLPGGYIYFTRWVTNKEAVFYRVTPDGKNLEEIYRLREGDNYPVPSPDGQYIAFATLIDGTSMKSVINVMKLDTQEITQLTSPYTLDTSPGWSADSKRIIFSSERELGGDSNIFAVNIDGSGLTGLITGEHDDFVGIWSPDGERIAFQSNRDGNHNIYVLEPDGQIQQLTDDPEDNISPEWSPDGTQITFFSGEWDDSDIYIINADGTELTQLTDDTSRNACPTWSPDGEYIVFHSDRGGEKLGIYIIRKDGTGLMRVVGGNKSSMVPYWIADPSDSE